MHNGVPRYGGPEGGDRGGLLGDDFAWGAFLLGVFVFFEHFFNQDGDRTLPGLPSSDFAVNGEGPTFGRACSISLRRFLLFLYPFNSSELSKTKTPVVVDLFWACRGLIPDCL